MSRSDSQSARESLYSVDDIKRIVSPIARRYDVLRMWLFGSYARREATLFSDLDFKVELDKAGNWIKYSGLCTALEDAFGMKIDLIALGSVGDDYLAKKFLNQISKEEVLIYEYIS